MLSEFDKGLFVNAVEELDTRLIPSPYMDQNPSYQVLEEILTSSTPLMEKKQLSHQQIRTVNIN